MKISMHIVVVFALGFAAGACGSSSSSGGTGNKDSGSTAGTDTGNVTPQPDVTEPADTGHEGMDMGQTEDTGPMPEDMGPMPEDMGMPDPDEGEQTPDINNCTPDCVDKVCGPDGCGGNCGTCGTGTACNEGIGICEPNVPPPEGACTNAADEAITNEKDLSAISEDCAIKNLGNAAGATKCIQDESGLSDGCTQCFADLLACTFANCIGDCIGGKSPACDACLSNKGCYGSFEECSGLDPNAGN